MEENKANQEVVSVSSYEYYEEEVEEEGEEGDEGDRAGEAANDVSEMDIDFQDRIAAQKRLIDDH